MAPQHFPTVVIGSGSAGLTVAIGLAQLGKEVALIEARAVGGDCTNVGCVPSKTLIHEAFEAMCHHTGGAEVLATVRHKRDELRDEETKQVAHTDHLTFYHGTARFSGPKQLQVVLDDGTTRDLTGDNIVIATGTRPAVQPIAGLPSPRTLTNENVFELPSPPGHLAIIGAGPVALELAFAFRRLGSRVSMIVRGPRVFSKATAAAAEVLHASLSEQGVAVFYHATASEYDEATLQLTLKTGAEPVVLEGVEQVLIATGRRRNIDNLGLEQTGVQYHTKTGIEVDSFGRTNVAGMYAIGDVTPTSFWTHSANAQGRRVVQRIAFPWLPALGHEPLYPDATFSDPEVANIGLMPAQIAKKYHPKLVKTLRFELAKTDKGYTEGLQHGFVEVYALRLTGRILGATIVGPRASEMISFFTLAISEGITLYKLFRLVYPYPTLSGAIQKVADQYVRETLPAFHTELLTVARYGAHTVWQRLRGGEFEMPPAVASSAAPTP